MRIGLFAIVLALACATACSREPTREPGLWDTASRSDVRIPAGEVTLAATLYRPAGSQGDLPAVVLSHESGPQTRDQNGFWTNVALQAGLAVLVYDKRGTGQSTGRVAKWNVDDTPQIISGLASDLAHATRWLQTQPGIRKDQIGMMGGSQAGWVIPLAASRVPNVRFLIIGSGVPLPTGAEDVHSRALSALGYDDESKAPLKAILAADAVTRSRSPYRGYDPTAALEALKMPVLWTFGLYDGVIPTRQSIERIRDMRANGRLNHDIHIFENGNHDFKDVVNGRPYKLAPIVSRWLDGIGIGRAQPQPTAG